MLESQSIFVGQWKKTHSPLLCDRKLFETECDTYTHRHQHKHTESIQKCLKNLKKHARKLKKTIDVPLFPLQNGPNIHHFFIEPSIKVFCSFCSMSTLQRFRLPLWKLIAGPSRGEGRSSQELNPRVIGLAFLIFWFFVFWGFGLGLLVLGSWFFFWILAPSIPFH